MGQVFELKDCIADKISQMCVPQIGWGSDFQRINTMCQEYGVALPEFIEIEDKKSTKIPPNLWKKAKLLPTEQIRIGRIR